MGETFDYSFFFFRKFVRPRSFVIKVFLFNCLICELVMIPFLKTHAMLKGSLL